jgi:hypothetical protein
VRIAIYASSFVPNCRSDRVSVSDIPKNGGEHGDVSLGDPDNMVDEGNRWVSIARLSRHVLGD